jgi:hypothetical protein
MRRSFSIKTEFHKSIVDSLNERAAYETAASGDDDAIFHSAASEKERLFCVSGRSENTLLSGVQSPPG